MPLSFVISLASGVKIAINTNGVNTRNVCVRKDVQKIIKLLQIINCKIKHSLQKFGKEMSRE